MRGVVMSYWRLLRVPFMFAFVLAAANLAIVGFVQPKARYAYEGLRFELRTGALGASIKIGEFTHFGEQMTIRIEQSRDQGRKLSGIFVKAVTKNGASYAVTAETGKFLATDNPEEIVFQLTNGVLINDAPNLASPRVLTFSTHNLPIPLPKIGNFRERGDSSVDLALRNVELTLPELAKMGRDPATAESLRDKSRSEYHFRVVEVATMFLLPLLALALGVPPKRSTSALGVFLAIVMVVTYHKVNQYAASIGSLGKIDPLIALWTPFVIFAALVGWMFYTIAYVPDGQPIGGLERWFGKIGKWILRRLPGRRREALA